MLKLKITGEKSIQIIISKGIYDANGLEVIDKYEIPMLQIDLINSNELFMGGIFYSNDGVSVHGKNKGSVFNGSLTDEVVSFAKEVELMFEYPAEDNLGKRRK